MPLWLTIIICKVKGTLKINVRKSQSRVEVGLGKEPLAYLSNLLVGSSKMAIPGRTTSSNPRLVRRFSPALR